MDPFHPEAVLGDETTHQVLHGSSRKNNWRPDVRDHTTRCANIPFPRYSEEGSLKFKRKLKNAKKKKKNVGTPTPVNSSRKDMEPEFGISTTHTQLPHNAARKIYEYPSP